MFHFKTTIAEFDSFSWYVWMDIIIPAASLDLKFGSFVKDTI